MLNTSSEIECDTMQDSMMRQPYFNYILTLEMKYRVVFNGTDFLSIGMTPYADYTHSTLFSSHSLASESELPNTLGFDSRDFDFS